MACPFFPHPSLWDSASFLADEEARREVRNECKGDRSEKHSRGICQRRRHQDHSLSSDVLSRLSKPKVRAENGIKSLEKDTIPMWWDVQHDYMSLTTLLLGREGLGGVFEFAAEKVGWPSASASMQTKKAQNSVNIFSFREKKSPRRILSSLKGAWSLQKESVSPERSGSVISNSYLTCLSKTVWSTHSIS